MRKVLAGTTLCIPAVCLGTYIALSGDHNPPESLYMWGMVTSLILIIGLGLIANYFFTK
jgi:hypothetical protein